MVLKKHWRSWWAMSHALQFAAVGFVLVLTSTLAIAQQPPSGGFFVGIGDHLWGRDRSFVDRSLRAAAAAQLKVIRWDVPWKAVETTKGKLAIPPLWDYIVDSASSRGIDSMLILDYGNQFYDKGDKPLSPEAVDAFARYAEFVAKHFEGRVRYYDVWNEWDGRTGGTTPGNAQDYARLVRAVYPRIKSVDPSTIVVVGSFDTSGYDNLVSYGRHKRTLDDYLSLPGQAAFGDAIGIHPYVVYRNGRMREYEGFVELLTAIVGRIRTAPGYESKPILITEVGWTTSSLSDRGVSELVQRDHILSALNLAKKLGVAGAMLYELRDGHVDAADPEAGFGLLRHDWTAKPVYEALRQ